jgi:hypothetical protein
VTVRLAPALALVCMALVLARCGGGSASVSPHRALQDVRDVAPVRAQFNADDGHPRLLVLLSPT